MNQPAAGAALGRILEVIVFVPDSNPEAYGPADIIGAGMQGPTPVAMVKDPDGNVIQWLGVPMKITQAPPSGLVAPSRSGGVLVPPNS